MAILTEESCIRKKVDLSLLKSLQQRLHGKNDLGELADLLTVAGNDTRLKILFLLSQEQELCVCDLADIMSMSVSSISHQLAKLRAHGFISKRRQGQTMYYRILDTPFNVLLKQLFDLED